MNDVYGEYNLTMPGGKVLLTVSNIVKRYISGAETLHILKGINFELEKGKNSGICPLSHEQFWARFGQKMLFKI